jgi:hypothetical protein
MHAEFSRFVSGRQNDAAITVVSDDYLLSGKAWVFPNFNQGKKCVHIYVKNVAASIIPLRFPC